MEISDVQAAKQASFASSKDIALVKKSNDMDKQMAAEILAAIPKVDHGAPPGKQVNMLA
jgi:hypothetical protein